MFSEKFGWQPIDTAPIDKDVMLIVTDGQGEQYAQRQPPHDRRHAAQWANREINREFRGFLAFQEILPPSLHANSMTCI
jgi:hypothetical protein